MLWPMGHASFPAAVRDGGDDGRSGSDQNLPFSSLSAPLETGSCSTIRFAARLDHRCDEVFEYPLEYEMTSAQVEEPPSSHKLDLIRRFLGFVDKA